MGKAPGRALPGCSNRSDGDADPGRSARGADRPAPRYASQDGRLPIITSIWFGVLSVTLAARSGDLVVRATWPVGMGMANRFTISPKRVLSWKSARAAPATPAAPLLDLRSEGNRPEACLYRATPCLLEGAIPDGRGLRIFALRPGQHHPYLEAALAARSSDSPGHRATEVLEAFFTNMRPRDAAEWLGFDHDEVPALNSAPPWAAVFPWAEDRVDDVVRARGKGSGSLFTIAHHANAPDPVPPHRIVEDAARVVDLLEAIPREGYRRHDGFDGDIGAIVLVRPEGSWRWLIRGGQHRAAVATALGYNSVPIRVYQVVLRDHVEHWPNVMNGTYSVSAALQLFDRLFVGELPASVRSWH